MTGPVTTEALVEKLAQTMWEQSHGTLANASWEEAHRIAKAIPDGQAAWNIETVRRKAAEIASLHVAPLLAAHQQVTAERDEYAEALMKVAEVGGWQASAGLAAEVQSALARLRAEGEAKDRRIAELTETWIDEEGKPWFPSSARAYAAVVASLIRTSNRFRSLNAEKRRLQAEVETLTAGFEQVMSMSAREFVSFRDNRTALARAATAREG